MGGRWYSWKVGGGSISSSGGGKESRNCKGHGSSSDSGDWRVKKSGVGCSCSHG